METHASAPLLRTELVQSRHLRRWNAFWMSRARDVRQESSGLRQHSRELQVRDQQRRQRYCLIACI
jgi:hypothetical protein